MIESSKLKMILAFLPAGLLKMISAMAGKILGVPL